MSEERKVPVKKKRFMPKAAAIVAAVAIVAGSGGAAYAMDIGGIQKKIQIWLHGEQTDATFTGGNGEYTLKYTDKDGKEVTQGGGGVAIEQDGTERPLTEEEMLEEIENVSPEVFYEEDGSVWVCYKDQKMDVTDKFKDGFCNVKLEADGEVFYVTIKYKAGYSVSPTGYASEEAFE